MKFVVSELIRHEGGFQTCTIQAPVNWGQNWHDAIKLVWQEEIPWSIKRAQPKFKKGELVEQLEEFILINFKSDEQSRQNGKDWIRQQFLLEVSPIGAFAVERVRTHVVSKHSRLSTALIYATKSCKFTGDKCLVHIRSNSLDVCRIKELRYGPNDWFLYLRPSPVSV